MESTAGAAAGSNREVMNTVFNAPFLIGACNGMLEAGRVGGVAGDSNADLFKLHDCNALGNIVCAITSYLCSVAG